MQTPPSNFRALRLRHGIPLTELSRASGKSHQYMSRLELLDAPITAHSLALAQAAFERVIAERQQTANALALDYERLKNQLLKEVDHEP